MICQTSFRASDRRRRCALALSFPLLKIMTIHQTSSMSFLPAASTARSFTRSGAPPARPLMRRSHLTRRRPPLTAKEKGGWREHDAHHGK